MDRFVIAVSRYRRRRYDEAIQLCDQMLKEQPLDQSAWVLKCSSMIRKVQVDDIEVDEEAVGDMLMDENVNTLARPGTSLQRPNTGSAQGFKPMGNQGRLQTGFARPVTHRQGAQDNVLKTARVGTSRTVTQGGRYLRLGTASLMQGEAFIQVERLDLKKMAVKPVVSRVLCDYLIYVEHNPGKALQLAAEATQIKNFEDWWWKERLGKTYFMLGLYREAEKQFQSSLKTQYMIKTDLQLAKVYLRFDQPFTAIEIYKKAIDKFSYESSFTIALARVYDMLNEPTKAIDQYKITLNLDNSNLEAVANIASYHFYVDQPEVSLQFYKRLIQLGVYNAEIWNNLGLCCFYDGQYDLFYSCFERALSVADDSCRAEIWYNMSHIYINIGDIGTAYQSLKLCLCLNPRHPEALNNIAVLQSKRGELDKSQSNFDGSIAQAYYLYEPLYNKALISFNAQDYAQCYQLLIRSLTVFPEHFESQSLKKSVEKILQQI